MVWRLRRIYLPRSARPATGVGLTLDARGLRAAAGRWAYCSWRPPPAISPRASSAAQIKLTALQTGRCQHGHGLDLFEMRQVQCKQRQVMRHRGCCHEEVGQCDHAIDGPQITMQSELVHGPLVHPVSDLSKPLQIILGQRRRG